MFFFSGVVFPIENLPPALRIIAEFFPLTHVVRPTRALCLGDYSPVLFLDFLFIVVFTLFSVWPAIYRIERRLIK
jgi:lipooligosaccharide transport system permease protein